MPRFCNSLVLTVLLISSNVSLAEQVAYLPDQELAKARVIVLAKWQNTPDRNDLNAKEMPSWNKERSTRLTILRVIKGKGIEPGERSLTVGKFVSWQPDGTRLSVSNGKQYGGMGDVADLTKPNLWFLNRSETIDEEREPQVKSLKIKHYRDVQPPVFEEYFAALRSESPRREVPKLLKPDQPEVAERILRFISGGGRLWPYDGLSELVDRQLPGVAWRTRLKDEAPRVLSVVNSKEESLRPLAVQVYAHIRGAEGLEEYRSLLKDRNPTVRGIAVGTLSRFQDEASLDGMQAALRGVDEPQLACHLMDAFIAWNDGRVVPLLVGFLQNNRQHLNCSGCGTPAIKARQTLHQLTNHWFPPDVDKSLAAWQKTAGEPDRTKRQQLLQKLLPGQQYPVQVEAITDRAGSRDAAKLYPKYQTRLATVRIRNASAEPILIAAIPTEASFYRVGSHSGASNSTPLDAIPNRPRPYVKIAPGQTHEFYTAFPDFPQKSPSDYKLIMRYFKDGKDAGLHAWTGTVSYQFTP